MKRRKGISILLILSLTLFAMASCGLGGSEPVREDMAGFDPETNQTIEVGGYNFEIPDYYVLNEELTSETNTDYKIADGEALVRFAFDDKSAESKDAFEEIRDDYLEGVISGVSDDAVADGKDFTCEVSGAPCSGRVELLYNEPLHTILVVIFMQRDDSAADYLPDFEKVIGSAQMIEASASESGSGSDTGLLSPEFKKTMDDYEAWFDHYCEVMKKYQENPSDIELLSEMTSLVTEETTMLEQMENMDESEMNTAELAYYIEVTARIEKKLLEVADY